MAEIGIILQPFEVGLETGVKRLVSTGLKSFIVVKLVLFLQSWEESAAYSIMRYIHRHGDRTHHAATALSHEVVLRALRRSPDDSLSLQIKTQHGN